MPHSTHHNRAHALHLCIEDAGPLRHTDNPDRTYDYATNLLSTLQRGGWHLVHADDLPAGYVPGDTLAGSPIASRTDRNRDDTNRLTINWPWPEAPAVPYTYDPITDTTNPPHIGRQEDLSHLRAGPQEPTHEAETLRADINYARDTLLRHRNYLTALDQRIERLETNTFGSADRINHLEEVVQASASLQEHSTQERRRLERELAELRSAHLSHIGWSNTGDHAEPHSHAMPHEDPDTQLGGHDNPHQPEAPA